MRLSVGLLLWALIAVAPANTAQSEESTVGFLYWEAADVPYKASADTPGLDYAVLSGDPDEVGVYILRLRIPPGLTFPPHFHDQDRHITVISGVWAFGRGYSGKCEDTIPLAVGAYVFHPKGAVHFDGACGKEPVEVQIIGPGPVDTYWAAGTD